jgi:DNA helicase HerA-like ATPase
MGESRQTAQATRFVGTIVGESTSREFRIAVAQEAIREQEIVAVDATLDDPGGEGPRPVRVWAKVQRIERVNPLFPIEAGHELAATRTSPFETVLSLSRELVTAVCQVLGAEPRDGEGGGKLDHVRYPPQPATTVYRPSSDDVARIVLGDLRSRRHRTLDIATLANRQDVDVLVDGHAVVTRHLAILAMTGAGKSWTARRIIEELAARNYPIVIFDPHGDYTGLADVPGLGQRVRRYYAWFPIFEQDAETVVTVVESLGWQLAKTHRERFESLFEAARAFLSASPPELRQRTLWLADYLGRPKIAEWGLRPDLYAFAAVVEAVVKASKVDDAEALAELAEWTGRTDVRLTRQQAQWLEAMPANLRTAAKRLRQMETISRKVSGTSEPMPLDRKELVRYGQISVVALAGYHSDFQATLYALVADAIFSARVVDELSYPVLLLLEEAHNFAPARAQTAAEQFAVNTTRQIAQEGRKFGVGLVLISQRPSRVDETTLSQCNSYVIMRMANPADQNYIRRVIETLGEAEADLLPDLDVGEALLSGQFINFPVLVRMKPPLSQGEREEEDAFVSLEAAHARRK